jgi:hypothetical protein
MTVESKLRILINITLLHIYVITQLFFSCLYKYYFINTNIHRPILDTTRRVVFKYMRIENTALIT